MSPKNSQTELDLNHLLKLSRNYATENLARSWRELIVSFLFAGLCFWGTLAPNPLAIRILAALFGGFAITRLFIVYHDVIHGAIFRESFWGRTLSHLTGYLVLRPPAEWRRSHDFHHLHNTQIKTSHIGSFPLYTDAVYAELPKLKKYVYKFSRSWIVIVGGYFFVFGLESIKKLFFKDTAIAIQSLVAILMHTAIVVSLVSVGGLETLFLSFIFPMTVACTLGTYLFYVQHNFEGAQLREDDSWDYAQSAMISSSCLRASPILHWLTGNIGFHHIHHLNPKIPFYYLPKAMKEVEEFQNPTFVGLTPSEILHSLKLKLWSPKYNSWVDFKGQPVKTK
jgi:omega-6 fatty acid desaturase (delta-12 desaturase)